MADGDDRRRLKLKRKNRQLKVTVKNDADPFFTSATTNRILGRENLSFSDELGITVELKADFVAAKPEIGACNARFDDNSSTGEDEEEFFYGRCRVARRVKG